MQKINFRGAGCNGPGLLGSITYNDDSFPDLTAPYGATWPLVKLTIDQGSVRFAMPGTKRTVAKSEIRMVVLSKIGYVFFRMHDGKDFGFATPRLSKIARELETRDFPLDSSWQRNATMARISLALPLIVMALVTAIIIVKDLQ